MASMSLQFQGLRDPALALAMLIAILAILAGWGTWQIARRQAGRALMAFVAAGSMLPLFYLLLSRRSSWVFGALLLFMGLLQFLLALFGSFWAHAQGRTGGGRGRAKRRAASGDRG
jgi:TRAP-type C4-dicarboxylate transport system permease small subunit